jgi:hypothetical protein
MVQKRESGVSRKAGSSGLNPRESKALAVSEAVITSD